jgi:hypothetical protein
VWGYTPNPERFFAQSFGRVIRLTAV